MKYIYDRESDSLSIVFAEGRRYRDSDEIHDGIVVDYDTGGRPIAIEFYDRASRFVDTDGLASGREVFVEHPDGARSADMSGEALRIMRLRLGFTQDQLAQQLSVGKNTVARWERNELTIEHSGMLKLALDALERSAARKNPLVDTKFLSQTAQSRRGGKVVFRNARESSFVTKDYVSNPRTTRKATIGSHRAAGGAKQAKKR